MYKTTTLAYTPVLSSCTIFLHPIAIARFGSKEYPNLAPADTSRYVSSLLKAANTKYEVTYRITPAAVAALAVITQFIQDGPISKVNKKVSKALSQVIVMLINRIKRAGKQHQHLFLQQQKHNQHGCFSYTIILFTRFCRVLKLDIPLSPNQFGLSILAYSCSQY